MQEEKKTGNELNQISLVANIMRGDTWIWTIYIFLACISVVEIFSASSQLTYKTASASDPAYRHTMFLVIGLGMLLFTQNLSLRAIRSWDKLLYIGGVALLFAAPFFGVSQKGAVRSIAGIQPVEVCKLAVVMMLCSAITAKDATYQSFAWFRTKIKGRRYLFYCLLVVLVAGPVLLQNLSSALIILMAALGIMFLGKVEGKYLWQTIGVGIIVGGIFLSGLYAVYLSTHPKDMEGIEDIESVSSQPESKENALMLNSWISRASTWANRVYEHSDLPLWEEDINGKKSQEVYSHMAIANGYPLGRFGGNSKMRDFLPEAFSDYIFAIIFEEWGPLGAILVLSLYLLLFCRCFILSRRTENPYIRLMMIGIPLIIVIQALIHIGVNTGAMFVTGQPLPLISRGGSSIMGTSISFGLMLALSRLIQNEYRARELEESEPEADETPATDQPSVVIEIPAEEGTE